MPKPNVLVVDADSRSQRVLSVSLRKAGYNVATCEGAEAALQMVESSAPALVISDTLLAQGDGFALAEALGERPGERLPFIFLSKDASVESKVRGLELGVEDYLTKPIFIREIVARVALVMERRKRDGMKGGGRTRFSGDLDDMSFVDLLQTVDISKKSGVLTAHCGEHLGRVYFHEGNITHAALGDIVGESAVYRMLRWSQGKFDFEVRKVRPEEQTVTLGLQTLLMEGMRRLDEWRSLEESLPSLEDVLAVDEHALTKRLAELPDRFNALLREFDGSRSLEEVIHAVDGDELDALTQLSTLYFEGVLRVTGQRKALANVPTSNRTLVGAETDRFELAPVATALETTLAATPREQFTTLPYGTAKTEATDAKKDEGAQRKSMGRKKKKQKGKKNKRARKSAASSSGSQSSASPSDASPVQAVAAEAAEAGFEGRESVHSVAPGDVQSVPPSERPSKTPEDPDRVSTDPAPAKEEAASSERPGKREETKSGTKTSKRNAKATQPDGLAAAAVSEAPVKVVGKRRPDPTDVTTSSGVIEALTSTGTHKQVTEGFFRAEAEEEEEPVVEEKRGMSLGNFFWMAVVLAMVGGFIYFLMQQNAAKEEEAAREARIAEEVAREDERLRAAGSQASVGMDGEEPAVDTGGGRLSETSMGSPSSDPSATSLTSAGSEPEPVAEPLVEPEAEPSVADPETLTDPSVGEPADPVAEPDPEPAVDPDPAVDLEPTEPPTTEPEPRQEPTAMTPRRDPPEPTAEPEPTMAPVAAGAYDELLATARSARGRSRREAYQQAVDAAPAGRGEAAAELAFIEINRGRNRQAAALAERAVAADPTNAKAWVTLGAARQSLGQRGPAMEAYRTCVDRGRGRYVSHCRAMLR